MQLEEYLHSLETFGIKLGLSQTTELMTRAGYCPEPGKKPYFIHLAGSNGKGSTGAMLQKALCNANFKTGFYTSPHLASFNERFRINGEMISDDELEEEFQKLLPRMTYLASSQLKCHFSREAFPDQPSVPHLPITFSLSSELHHSLQSLYSCVS